MKKLLLTLTALLTASTVFADSGYFFGTLDKTTLGSTNESYLEISRKELSSDKIDIGLWAYWSARVNGTECWITFPEGMHVTFAEDGADWVVTTLNSSGRYVVSSAKPIGVSAPYNHFTSSFDKQGYYRNENGEIENYGIVKWEAGYHEEMKIYYIQFDEGFTGGDIVVETNVTSTDDTRGGTVIENGENGHNFTFTCHVTVEGELPGYIIVGSPAANGQFNVNYMPGDYEGEYEIIVTINGEEVEPIAEGTYKAREGENNVVVTVKADGYNDKVATNTFYFHYPASPTYVVTYDDDFMYITFSCEEGELTIYDEYGQEVAENPVKIARPEYDEGAAPVYVHYSAKATKDGVDSEIIHVTEMVNQKDNTGSVNELNSNKQVVSVRYFNMVGQEMRQANGLTIVVNTYNDGTTNAVKMIK